MTPPLSDPMTVSARLSRFDLIAIIPALFFATTAVTGAVLWFSTVPFWDMWDGTVVFHFQRQADGISAFFAQANEHRILWSKLLFLADYKLFGGSNYLLIAANVVLMSGLWIAFALAARQLGKGNDRAAFLAAMLVALPCFSWLQAENINWGYQSQFFLAYLLPLLAFLSLAHWLRNGREAWYIASLVLGIASSVSMANGLLALPLLIVMLLINRRFGIGRLLGLVAVTGITIWLWLRNYQPGVHTEAPLLEKLKFLLTFLGAPGHWIFQSEALSLALGVTVVLSGLFFALAWMMGKTREPSFSALVMFLLYVGAAAAAAANGRAYGGYQLALAGRYETPVMLAYASIILMAMHLGRHRAGTPAALATMIGALTVIFLPTQLQAISNAGLAQAHARTLAALALDLGIRDTNATKLIYPADSQDRVDHVHRIAQRAIAENFGVFALPEMRIARSALGKAATTMNLELCSGHLDNAEPIATDGKYVKVRGWIFDPKTQKVPKIAFIVSNGTILGVGLTGTERPDVQQTVSPSAIKAGFDGYGLSSLPSEVQIFCAPRNLFTVVPSNATGS